MISLIKNLHILSILKPAHLKDLIKMQTSIKMFFKAKEPTAGARLQQRSDTVENQVIENEQKEQLSETIKTTSPKHTIDIENNDDSDSPKKKQPYNKGNNKRIILDSSDDESDDNKMTKKRPMVSSPLSTPLKLQEEKVKEELNKCDDEKKIINEKPSTPTVQKVFTQEKLKLATSPLIDVKQIVKMKISAGATALHENIGSSWFRALQAEFDKQYFKKLSAFVQQERKNKTVYPPEDKVYSWTHHHNIKDTRVIILGQDPYFNPGQAHGLSFSVQKGIKAPPSLVNIYKELENDIDGFKPPMNGNYVSGDLTGWAKQGVLMLNTCLTVNQGQANSHQNKGWETFTDAVITWISKNIDHKVVFLLWGRPAQRKTNLIDKRHKILAAAHPSPLSAHNGFMGCGHFSKTNSFLREQGLKEIDWKAL